MSIDICMAVYNGRQFLEKQINSIINNNNKASSVNFIFFDDSSLDNSTQFLCQFFESHPHLTYQLYQNSKNRGYVQTFGQSLRLSRAPSIMLSDQDDIWPVNRIQFLKVALDDSNRELVIGNFTELRTTSSDFIPSSHHLLSINARPFRKLNLYDYIFSIIPLYGCCFAFKKSLKKYILPIPSFVDSHDRWIALISILKGSCFYTDTVVTVRGLHNSNETRPLPFHLKMVSFFVKIVSIFYAFFRILRVDLVSSNQKFFS